MRTNFSPLVIFSVLVLLAMVAGCSDDDPVIPEPEIYSGLHGVVVDVDGNPLEGVSIGLIYDFPGAIQPAAYSNVISNPAEKPLTGLAYDLPEPAHVHLWITDYAGNFVISLIDEVVTSGNHIAIWSALNEAGDPVPSGMYFAHVQIEELEPEIFEVFLHFLDPADFLRHPNAVTNERGEFRIPDSLIPVGETMEALNEMGEVVDVITISTHISMRAVREGVTDPEWAGLSVTYLSGGLNGELQLVLP